MDISIDQLLGPLGSLATFILISYLLYAALKEASDKRIAGLERSIAKIEGELAHCQTQHTQTIDQLLKMANENGYLRGRVESIEHSANMRD